MLIIKSCFSGLMVRRGPPEAEIEGSSPFWGRIIFLIKNIDFLNMYIFI